MLLLSQEDTHNALRFPDLIDALADMFKAGCEMPVRHHHDMRVPGEPDGTMLLMPAWVPGGHAGVKILNVMPGNSTRGLPAISAEFLLSDARTGEMLALIDGGELTARRTAAASALAARFLAKQDAEHLLVVGTGRLSLNLIEAHAAVRPIKRVSIWGRRKERAEGIAWLAKESLAIDVEVAEDLDEAISQADIVSTCTLSNEPLIKGALLKPGAHVDLVGAFKPSMRESDDDAIRRASVFVDTPRGLHQGGRRHRPAAAVGPPDRGGYQGRPLRAHARATCRQGQRRRNHSVQVGGCSAGRPGRRDPGLSNNESLRAVF